MALPNAIAWGPTLAAAPDTLVFSNNLTDGAVDDTSTSEVSSVPWSTPDVCTLQSASAYVIGQGDFGGSCAPLTYRFTYLCTNDQAAHTKCPTGGETLPPSPIPQGQTYSLLLRFWDCVSMAWISGGSINPANSVPNANNPLWRTIAGSFGAVPGGASVRYVQVVAISTQQVYSRNNNYSQVAMLSDMRLTANLITLSAPANLATLNVCEGTQVTLTWDAVAGAKSYRVYQNGVLVQALAAPLTGPVGTIIVSSGMNPIVLGQTYVYTVAAVDACGGVGNLSNSLPVTPCSNGGGGGGGGGGIMGKRSCVDNLPVITRKCVS